MRVTLLLICVIILNTVSGHPNSFVGLIDKFNKWKEIFNKSYHSLEHHQRHFNNWKRNTWSILKHNYQYDLGLKSYRLAINKYADLDFESFSKSKNGLNYQKEDFSEASTSYYFYKKDSFESLPDRIDWREHGLVTGVKNQGDCGACWAFSATGSIEGQMKKWTGKLISLSEQDLIDCSKPEGLGCEGGLMKDAYLYVERKGTLATEQSYPYEKHQGKCRSNFTIGFGKVKTFVKLPPNDEDALLHAVANVGPISAALDVHHHSFQFYNYGVYSGNDCSSDTLNHAVLVVGYDSDPVSGLPYWIVKNSWGEHWGDKGYIKIARNQSNMCGIATQPSYPVV